MGLNKSTSSLKKEARGLLLGNYRSAISLLLASNLIISTLTLFIGSSGGLSLLNLIIDYLVSFILTLLSCILQVGQYSFYLKVACRQQTQFKDLFEDSYSRSEVINTFLALLELLKRQYITVTQNNLFDDIDIVRNDDTESILTEAVGNEFDGDGE